MFWDVCIGGIVVYISPNFYIAETIHYSSIEYWSSVGIIAALCLLLCFTHWKVWSVRRQTDPSTGALPLSPRAR